LMGACLAFLIYNFHPAKIFLGDSGAIFLGFMLASMGLRVANHEFLPLLTR
ncbi:MAG: undecaprenyl/decaprenyl-phosphate alpha-N-acetylglucosaminyl 1-phosphate transferase, partial [Syntrophaceae bacterium]|nr:undecaprenyl/decaprenyl-phosphate alpha-N-acetylglucosaminyl 1-phosphate transferase [Syntrophaceae bacterium]